MGFEVQVTWKRPSASGLQVYVLPRAKIRTLGSSRICKLPIIRFASIQGRNSMFSFTYNIGLHFLPARFEGTSSLCCTFAADYHVDCETLSNTFGIVIGAFSFVDNFLLMKISKACELIKSSY